MAQRLLNLAKATANFDKAIAFYQNTLGLFARWSQQIIENRNPLLWDQAFCQSVVETPIFYYHGHFRLEADEAPNPTRPTPSARPGIFRSIILMESLTIDITGSPSTNMAQR